MKNNSLKLSQDRFVSVLYSLTGPQENLPSLLSNILGLTKIEIEQKLHGEILFTASEIDSIQNQFNNSALQIAKIA